MSVENRFYAAVNVISGLPKHGPYQPSHEMKLSFYSYYKQATEGPNTDPKPWTWEVVKRAKWDAWKNLGDMTKEEAMSKYVEELNKIVETMSYTENVADFLKSMDDFNTQDNDKSVILAIESCNKTPEDSLSITNSNKTVETSLNKITSTSRDIVEDDDDEYYTDSVETSVITDRVLCNDTIVVLANGHSKHDSNIEQESTTDILMRTVLTLRTEMNEVTSCVRKIEQKQKLLSRRNGLFRGLSHQTISFIILWPVIANLILLWLYSRRRLHPFN